MAVPGPGIYDFRPRLRVTRLPASEVSSVVMADPDGNELCVPRPLTPEELATG